MMQLEKDTPKKQCRGWFIPIEIVELFEAEEINAAETLLLATIDSLVSKKRGCFAGNEYLAKRMSTSKDKICRMIGKLKGLGLLRQISFNGRIRELETVWSRIVIPDQPREESESSIGKFPEADPGEFPKPNRVYNSSKQIESVLKVQGDSKATPPPQRHISPVPVKELLLTDWDRKGGRRLKQLLANHDSDLVHTTGKRRGVRIDTLAKSIFQLRVSRSVSKIEIKEMIDWLDLHWDEEYVPKIYKANDLFTKWRQFCDCKERWEQSETKHGGWSDYDSGYETIADLGNWLVKQGLWDPFDPEEPFPNQEMIDKALVARGRKPGTVQEGDVRGVGNA